MLSGAPAMIFIDNKYTKWYYAIIANAKTRNLTTRKQAKEILGYVEHHHIIPDSLGGPTTKENMIFLTAHEHFVCHLLLPKMTEGENKVKMACAAWALVNQESRQIRYKVTGRIYEQLKRNFSLARTGRKLAKSVGDKISATKKANKQPAWNSGKKMSAEQTKNMKGPRPHVIPHNKGKRGKSNIKWAKTWIIHNTITNQSETILSLRQWCLNKGFNYNTAGDYARQGKLYKGFQIISP